MDLRPLANTLEDVRWLLVAAAVLLLLAAAFGGFRAKEVEVPRLSTMARMVSGLVGGFLLALVVIPPILPPPVPGLPTPTPTPTTSRGAPDAPASEQLLDQPTSTPLSTPTPPPSPTPTPPPTSTPEAPTEQGTVVTFEAFPDRTPITQDLVLEGDEFAAEGILVAGAPHPGYCTEATAGGIQTPPFPQGRRVQSNYLTTSTPEGGPRCQGLAPIEVTFIRPVSEVTIDFFGALRTYTFRAFDAGGRLVDHEEQDGLLREADYATVRVGDTSMAPVIKRVVLSGPPRAGLDVLRIAYRE